MVSRPAVRSWVCVFWFLVTLSERVDVVFRFRHDIRNYAVDMKALHGFAL